MSRQPSFTPAYPAPPKLKVLPALYNFEELCAAMKSRKKLTLESAATKETVTGLINGIRPESGDGKQWLVTVCPDDNKEVEIYLKTE
jgi:hypothetical protein